MADLRRFPSGPCVRCNDDTRTGPFGHYPDPERKGDTVFRTFKQGKVLYVRERHRGMKPVAVVCLHCIPKLDIESGEEKDW